MVVVDEAGQPPTVESIRAALNSGSPRAFRASLTSLAYVESSDDPVLAFVVALWQRDLAVVTDEEWKRTHAPGIRIQIANSLARLYHAQMVEVDIAPIIAALRRAIRSDDEDAVLAGIYGLTDFTDDGDVDQLGKLVIDTPGGSKHVAITAMQTLSVSCAPTATATLGRIAASDIPKEVRDAMVNFPEELTAYRKRKCGR